MNLHEKSKYAVLQWLICVRKIWLEVKATLGSKWMAQSKIWCVTQFLILLLIGISIWDPFSSRKWYYMYSSRGVVTSGSVTRCWLQFSLKILLLIIPKGVFRKSDVSWYPLDVSVSLACVQFLWDLFCIVLHNSVYHLVALHFSIVLQFVPFHLSRLSKHVICVGE